MNSAKAKQILTLHRPHAVDAPDPAVDEALAVVAQDAELQRWFDQHQAVEAALRAKFRELPVPAHLPEAILARRRAGAPDFNRHGAHQPSTVIAPSAGSGPRCRSATAAPERSVLLWWRRPLTLAAAAAAVMLLAGALVWWGSPRVPDRFADFRSRMVRTVLREYRMDIRTNDMAQVRQFLGQRGGPADYAVPERLEQLRLTGAGLLRWRNHPVSMICFDRGDQQMLFLFVLDRAALRDAPASAPQLGQINKLATASWTQGDHAYLLAGPPDTPPDRYL